MKTQKSYLHFCDDVDVLVKDAQLSFCYASGDLILAVKGEEPNNIEEESLRAGSEEDT